MQICVFCLVYAYAPFPDVNCAFSSEPLRGKGETEGGGDSGNIGNKMWPHASGPFAENSATNINLIEITGDYDIRAPGPNAKATAATMR